MRDFLEELFLEHPRHTWRVVSGSSSASLSEILPRRMTEAGAARFASKHGIRLAKVLLPGEVNRGWWAEAMDFYSAYIMYGVFFAAIFFSMYFLMK